VKISIITATLNSAFTLSECLQSITSQNYPNEHIIIDGASTDTTLEIVRRISPTSRILSEPDKGIYDAMNKGIDLATGEVVGILNADDFYASTHVLEKVARAFEDPAVMTCYGDLEYILPSAERSGGKAEPSTSQPVSGFSVYRYWKSGAFSPEKFYWGWMPPHPTFFVRRSIYEKFGKFRPDLGTAADYELMLRFLLKERISSVYIPDVLVRMRAGGASNRSLLSRLRANRMDYKAWKANGLKPYPWTLFCKPLRKISQWFVR